MLPFVMWFDRQCARAREEEAVPVPSLVPGRGYSADEQVGMVTGQTFNGSSVPADLSNLSLEEKSEK